MSKYCLPVTDAGISRNAKMQTGIGYFAQRFAKRRRLIWKNKLLSYGPWMECNGVAL